jgi:TonB family protein
VVYRVKPILGVPFVAILYACLGCAGASEPAKPAPPPAKPVAKSRPKVKRALSPEQLQATMKGRVGEMAACYELSPAKQKQVTGELTVDFTVEASGKVSGESLASDSVADKLLSDCVLGVVRETSFPPAEAAVDVSWPMHFGAR